MQTGLRVKARILSIDLSQRGDAAMESVRAGHARSTVVVFFFFFFSFLPTSFQIIAGMRSSATVHLLAAGYQGVAPELATLL